MQFDFSAPLFRWDARIDSWFFVALPLDAADAITALPLPPRGFGAVKVKAQIGTVHWDTSVFPDAGLGTYVLAVKKAIRQRYGLEEGSVVEVHLDVLR